jgi:glycosyltransferase involved in cell wall biosynthesis
VKITIISIFFYPEKGAAPFRITTLAQTLKKKGYDVEVITALPNYPTGKIFEGYKRKLRVIEKYDDISIRRYWHLPSNSNNPFLRIISMFSFAITIWFSLFHLLRSKPDFIIIQTPPLFVGLSSVWLSKLTKAKRILNVSDVWPLTALELGVVKKGLFYSFSEWVEKKMYKGSQLILGQSNEILQHVNKFVSYPSFLYRNLESVSPYLDNTPFFNPSASKPKIVYAGLLGLAQGVYPIIQNIDFKQLGIEFHIYGNGVEQEKIEAFISENADCNIFYHGSIPKSEMPITLSKYHATIVPLTTRIYGAFPSKIFMGISNGLPIFFCGEGEGADFIKEHQIGWVAHSSDFKQLNENIKTFNSLSNDEYQTLRGNCRKLASNSCNINFQADSFDIFLKEHIQ